jgi:hypothetical protein
MVFEPNHQFCQKWANSSKGRNRLTTTINNTTVIVILVQSVIESQFGDFQQLPLAHSQNVCEQASVMATWRGTTCKADCAHFPLQWNLTSASHVEGAWREVAVSEFQCIANLQGCLAGAWSNGWPRCEFVATVVICECSSAALHIINIVDTSGST